MKAASHRPGCPLQLRWKTRFATSKRGQNIRPTTACGKPPHSPRADCSGGYLHPQCGARGSEPTATESGLRLRLARRGGGRVRLILLTAPLPRRSSALDLFGRPPLPAPLCAEAFAGYQPPSTPPLHSPLGQSHRIGNLHRPQRNTPPRRKDAHYPQRLRGRLPTPQGGPQGALHTLQAPRASPQMVRAGTYILASIGPATNRPLTPF